MTDDSTSTGELECSFEAGLEAVDDNGEDEGRVKGPESGDFSADIASWSRMLRLVIRPRLCPAEFLLERYHRLELGRLKRSRVEDSKFAMR